MNTLFILLSFAAIIALIVGLTNPAAVKMKSRKQVGSVFGIAIIVLLVLAGSTSKSDQTQTAVVVTPTPTTPSIPAPVAPTQPVVSAPKKTMPVSIAPVVAPTLPAPAPVYQPTTLLNISGSGSKSTDTFTVPTNSWELGYTYDCSSFGDQGNFQVSVFNSDGSMSFENSSVNQLGRSGADTQYYHSGNGSYYLEVNSECDWTINVKG